MGSPEVLTSVPTALTIAGSDSGGGAGIQADLKTFLALGVHGMSAITALTAQNTTGVSEIHEVPPAFVREQISQVATDIGVGAAKTGMLSNAGVVVAVAEAIQDFQMDKLVVDPVFVSKSRDRLLREDAVDALVNKLFPLALVITPNLYEAGALLGREVSSLSDMREAAKGLHAMGPRYVLVKGGHLEDSATDIGYDGETYSKFESLKVDSLHTHGTGCTLSAAITALLARGIDLHDAIAQAKEFVTGAIKKGLAIGKGYGPVNPGWDSTLRG